MAEVEVGGIKFKGGKGVATYVGILFSINLISKKFL